MLAGSRRRPRVRPRDSHRAPGRPAGAPQSRRHRLPTSPTIAGGPCGSTVARPRHRVSAAGPPEDNCDDRARFDLFERINTGSKIANKAEVRRGALGGPFIDLVIELSTNTMFESLAPVSDNRVKLREREELVTRFFAYGDGLDDYRDRVSPFLFDYAKRMTSHLAAHPATVKEYRQRFLDTMTFIDRVFPFGFRRGLRGTATPRTRFEAIAVGSYLALKDRPALATANIDVNEWLTGREFESIIRADGANVIRRLRSRLYFVRDRLLGAPTQ